MVPVIFLVSSMQVTWEYKFSKSVITPISKTSSCIQYSAVQLWYAPDSTRITSWISAVLLLYHGEKLQKIHLLRFLFFRTQQIRHLKFINRQFFTKTQRHRYLNRCGETLCLIEFSEHFTRENRSLHRWNASKHLVKKTLTLSCKFHHLLSRLIYPLSREFHLFLWKLVLNMKKTKVSAWWAFNG